MHPQQTKRKSRESGGPQYYFHNLSEAIKTYLRAKGAVPVALVTPYGPTKTDYLAVSTDKKLDSEGNVVAGKVGHDRIQQAKAGESIGESIRFWYGLPAGDFERIDVEIDPVDDAFYLTPTRYKRTLSKSSAPLSIVERPLTFTRHYISRFWKEHLSRLLKGAHGSETDWAFRHIAAIADAHVKKVPHIQETDLLRAYGPLVRLGLALGPYVGRGFDCLSTFQFGDLPIYHVPVEIKRQSKDFRYQMRKYGKDELSRAVVLCAVHDMDNVPRYVDVIELSALGEYRQQL